MSSELKIQDLGSKKCNHPLDHTFLPNIPMRMLVIAPSNGGKSNMLKNMLLRPEFGYRKYFTDPKTGALKEQSMWGNVLNLYTLATSQKYGFLYLNKDTGKAYHNFERLLQ